MLLNKFPGGGVSIEAATAQPSHVLAPRTFFAGENEEIQTGTIPSKGAQTYTPGAAAQTIAAGQYLSGIQTIAGDADLIASNIRSGVNIFNVVGTGPGLPASIAAGDTSILFKQGVASLTAGSYTDYPFGYGFYCNISGVYRIMFGGESAYPSGAYLSGPVYLRLIKNGVEVSGSSITCYNITPKTIDVTVYAGETVRLQGYGMYHSNIPGYIPAFCSHFAVTILASALQAENNRAITIV